MSDAIITNHRVINGDSRVMSYLGDESVHFVLTSPPYWYLKRYNDHPDNLGHIDDYELFLDELCKVWKECYRVLKPGCRMVCVCGNVCLSRKNHGRHRVMPLYADISVQCRKLGYDNLNSIIVSVNSFNTINQLFTVIFKPLIAICHSLIGWIKPFIVTIKLFMTTIHPFMVLKED